MAWQRSGDKPLSAPMRDSLTDALRGVYASLGLNVLIMGYVRLVHHVHMPQFQQQNRDSLYNQGIGFNNTLYSIYLKCRVPINMLWYASSGSVQHRCWYYSAQFLTGSGTLWYMRRMVYITLTVIWSSVVLPTMHSIVSIPV